MAHNVHISEDAIWQMFFVHHLFTLDFCDIFSASADFYVPDQGYLHGNQLSVWCCPQYNNYSYDCLLWQAEEITSTLNTLWLSFLVIYL